jgi:hypothetical protein
MNERKLARIAQRMTTEDFAVDLHISRLKMNHADATGARYDPEDLARDLRVPPVIALILIRFIIATEVENRMSDILEAQPQGAVN